MISYIKSPYIVLHFLLFLFFSEVTWAIGAPSASTATNQTININVEGAILLGGTETAITRAISTTISSQPGFNDGIPSTPSAHFASAEIAVAVPNPFSLTTDANTASISSTNEPLFARSYVYGSAFSTSLLLSSVENSTLHINWQFEEYQINIGSTPSFSQITDTLRVSSQTVSVNPDQTISLGDKTSTLFSFTSSIENNHLISSFVPESNENELIIKGSLPEIVLPLAREIGQFLVIEIEHIHTEYSIEAPATATNQVEEKAGYDGLDGNNELLFWDSNKNELSFSAIPIEILSNGGDTSLQKYSNDPLNGGHIEIDPLIYIESDNGIDYFEGNEIRLVDLYGNTLLTASLPTVAFDNKLYEIDGFNLFAPILNILEVNSGSQWLEDYLSKGGVDSLLLNELFIGFDTNGISWENDFEVPVTAFLSYTGIQSAQIPEPMMPILFLIGLIALIIHFTFVQTKLKVNF
jgi:hypothetical protein